MNTVKRVCLLFVIVFACCWPTAYASPASYDVIRRGGTIYDGSGGQPYSGEGKSQDTQVFN